MPDYRDRSPKSYQRAYKPHRDDRTSTWLNHLPQNVTQLVGPDMPPSDTDSAIFSSDSDEELSSGYYSSRHASQRDVRSRTTSVPVDYGPQSHHHSRSTSFHQSGGYPRASEHPSRHRSSSGSVQQPEQIRIRPAPRSMAPTTPGYPRSARVHHPRTSSLMGSSPRRGHDHDFSDAERPDDFVVRYGPPEAIKFSQSHPPSQFDPRGHPSSGHRPRPSSRRPSQSVMGSPSSQMTMLTKENTIANSHSRTFARGVIEDNWSVVDRDEEWEKEQQRAAYRRGRTSSQASNSPPLTHSRSRTTSTSSGYYPPPPRFSVSFYSRVERWTRELTINLKGSDKLGPPPAHSSGKRHFFSRWFFRNDSDKDVHMINAPPSNRLRRHSTGGSRR